MTTKTDIKQERAAFELWARDQWYPLQRIDDYDNDYKDDRTQGVWGAWQARAAAKADRQDRMPSDEEIANWVYLGQSIVDPNDVLTEMDFVKLIRAALLRYGNGQPAANPVPVKWEDAQRIVDIPEIDELLTGFSEDPTGDNGTMIVLAVMQAAGQTAASAEPVAILRHALEYAQAWISAAPHGDNCHLDPDHALGQNCECGKESILAHIESALEARAAPAAQEPVAPWRNHRAAIDAKALSTAQEIALMWGADRSQFVSRIQVVVIEAMWWMQDGIATPVAAQAQPTMPALTDPMRAVLLNEHDVYGSPEELYAALCEAAEARPSTQDREDVLTQAARDVLAERQRQIEAEGWTPEHDDEHVDYSLSQAAAYYAMDVAGHNASLIRRLWPWASEFWKPDEPRRNLVKAGALIQAEIERIDRAAARAAKETS